MTRLETGLLGGTLLIAALGVGAALSTGGGNVAVAAMPNRPALVCAPGDTAVQDPLPAGFDENSYRPSHCISGADGTTEMDSGSYYFTRRNVFEHTVKVFTPYRTLAACLDGLHAYIELSPVGAGGVDSYRFTDCELYP